MDPYDIKTCLHDWKELIYIVVDNFPAFEIERAH